MVLKRDEVIIIVILSFFLVSGVLILSLKTKSTAKVIRIGYQPYVATHSNIILALKNLHLLEKKGYKPVFVPFLAGPPLNEAMLSGKIDIGFAGDFPIVSLLASGVDVKIIGVTNKTLRQAVVVDIEKVNEIKTIEDLKNRKIALVKGSSSHCFFLRLLKRYGIDPRLVEIIHTDVTNQPLALIANQVDAIVSWEPWPTKIEKEKIGKILIEGEYSGYIFAQEKLLKAESQKVQDFIKALQEALEFSQRKLSQTCLWAEKEIKEKSEIICDASKFDKILIPGQTVFPEDELIEKLNNIARFAFEEGLISKVPDVKEKIEISLIENTLKNK